MHGLQVLIMTSIYQGKGPFRANYKDQPNPSIRTVLEEAFSNWNMAPEDLDDYGLRYGNVHELYKKYVSEDVDADGTVRICAPKADLHAAEHLLILDYSPRRVASNALHSLTAGAVERTDCASKARDLLETAKRYEGAVREPLVNQGAMTIAIEFLNNLMGRMAEKQNQQAILSIMEFIDLLIGHGGLSSENVEELLHLTAQGDDSILTIEWKDETASSLVPLTLKIIVGLCQREADLDPDGFDAENFLPTETNLQMMETYKYNIDVSASVLRTFNSLYDLSEKKPETRKKMLKTYRELKIRDIVGSKLIRKNELNPLPTNQKVKKEMVQLQTFIIQDLLDVCRNLEESEEVTLRKIKEIAKANFQNDHQYGSKNSQDWMAQWKALGFTDNIDPSQDIKSSTYGNLALNLMWKYAHSMTEKSQEFVFNSHTDKNGMAGSACPFALCSIRVVELICQVLNERCQDNSTGYARLCLFNAPIEEEPYLWDLYKILMGKLLKTWQDMEAHLEDLSKVMDVTHDQINKSLQTLANRPPPCTMKEFEECLPPYDEVLKEWKTRVADKNNYAEIKKMTVIKELIEALAPDVYNLIRDQRLNCLKQGEKFHGTIHEGGSKSSKPIFCKLTQNHKTLLWTSDTAEFDNDRLSNRIPVSDIKHPIQGSNDRIVINYSISGGQPNTMELSLKSTDSHKTFQYWLDGLRCLVENRQEEITGYQQFISKERSKEFMADFESWMELKVKLKLMPLNGVEIPEEPPEVPPLPQNLEELYQIYR